MRMRPRCASCDERVDLTCPSCGDALRIWSQPGLTVDAIIELWQGRENLGIVLVERGKPPYGWALPGGFVDYGERPEDAARREALEETGLEIELLSLFHVYGDPARDERHHNVSVVYIARAEGTPMGGDDAAGAKAFALDALPGPIVFDHAEIIEDYAAYKRRLLSLQERRTRGLR
ncbi:MAG: NUDIX domain-containing protein [Armatimonadota bacterium]